jgi:tripartite-type tricarboxylate transporter receptor subunit TctC
MSRRSTMNILRGIPFCVGVTGIALCFASPAWAPHVDDHPGRLVVPVFAGSPPDAAARTVAQKAGETLRAPIIVDNRPDALGIPGVQSVKDTAPDGSVLLFTPSTPMTVLPSTVRGLPYDSARDFVPITQVATIDFAIAVSANARFRTLNDLVTAAKERPDTIRYVILRRASISHLAGVVFTQAAGIKMQAVPFARAPDTIHDLLAGTVDVAIAHLGDFVELHRAGQIRILAKYGRERSPLVPDVPTLREGGYDVAVTDWYGIFAPAGTPSAVVDRLNRAFAGAVRSPDVRERLIPMGLQPTGTTAGQLREIRTADEQLWRRVVTELDRPSQ